MHALLSDFLYAFRIFFKRPGLTLLAIFALAFSLGLSTHTFSILNGMFFKPLPYKDPKNLYVVYLQNPESTPCPFPSNNSSSCGTRRFSRRWRATTGAPST